MRKLGLCGALLVSLAAPAFADQQCITTAYTCPGVATQDGPKVCYKTTCTGSSTPSTGSNQPANPKHVVQGVTPCDILGLPNFTPSNDASDEQQDIAQCAYYGTETSGSGGGGVVLTKK
jgi:hypothetical protein